MDDRLALPAGDAYRAWVREHDTLTGEDRRLIRAHVALLPRQPAISVVMPMSGASEAALREAIASVRAQLYPHWDLCVADGAPREAGASRALDEAAHADLRVRRTPPGSAVPGGDVCASMNAALASASGDFVALVGHGDLLPEHALYEVAVELAAHPDADLVYTDEDSFDSEGRSAPRFKPMWSPELLAAHDVIGGLAVYRRALLERIGGVRPELGDAQGWDLALRATAATTPDRVRHVPAVLHHRRRRPEAPGDPETRRRGRAAGRRAVRDHLDAQGSTEALLEAAPLAPGCNRVVHPLPSPAPLVSVIIPTRDRAALLERVCAGVLGATAWNPLELLLVDNGSVEPAALALLSRLEAEDARVRVLRRPGPFNYPRLNNEAAREARGDVLVMLNSDMEIVEPAWLDALVRHALRRDVGIVGAKLLYPDGRVQHGGMVLGPAGAAQHVHRFAEASAPGYLGQLALARTLSSVTGACVALRRGVYEEVGGLDEALAVTFNDVDLCLRIADFGYRAVWTPDAVLLHMESATRGADGADPARRAQADAEWAFMRRRWGRLLDEDPYHNPNVLLHEEPIAVPSPPRRGRPWRRASAGAGGASGPRTALAPGHA
ncbi:MAG: Glycosyl transferase, group 2 family [uncultured Acetobacteraceae bacterium]|uniref:Glycosyl transferase, group 2 family n=1 Tax=uncultured Acetobacteraceae bacterium TaxID=169975 RepID=A0A6J4IJ41_9PROT|nr:MAG: Glycosyl transferase, group 2 family [uncultured Acetobacteraceae bacterium]